MLNRQLTVVALIILFKFSFAQNIYHFTKGLMISSGSKYGREAIYTDELAYKIYQHDITTPTEGGIFGTNEKGEKLIWKPMQTDSLGRFSRFAILKAGVNTFGNPTRADRGADYLYVTYQSDKEKVALLHIKGNSGVFVNGIPHMGDPYSAGYVYIPIKLKKGLNEFYIRGIDVTADLIFNDKKVLINTEDPTLPSIVLDIQNGLLKAAVVVINSSITELKSYSLKSSLNGIETTTPLPIIPAMASRKVMFDIDTKAINTKGKFDCALTLLYNGKIIDENKINLEATDGNNKYSTTFISTIDGSLQYYAVAPQIGGDKNNAALFLSVHGAGVEASGQARAYQSKDWGTLVAATNRRPRGFNWEDWGRLDALEVLQLAKNRFNPDPEHIYLTGHSMGGHGSWFLGATYPDKWAAIAPCSGYPTLKDYGSADGKIPDSSKIEMEKLLLRAGNQSDVLKLVMNYKPLGVYILHGDSDKVVPVKYARQIRNELGKFHADFTYYEYPGGEHWFGDQSVDWKPMFNYLRLHKLANDSMVNEIDFTTSSPGISSTFRWATIQQQIHPLEYSHIILHRNNKLKTITGTTENIDLLQLDLKQFTQNSTIKITLDSLETINYTTNINNDILYLKKAFNKWIISTGKPTAEQKNPIRYGTFKEAFNYNMVFIYGTSGTAAETEANYNKAIYDAESWYYRGNGAVDVISDKAYLLTKYAGRNIIIYGNANTNSAYNNLLKDCPIQISRNTVKAGATTLTGDDFGAYFVWPQNDGKTSVGVIAGTGIKGMNAANGNQYFAGGSGFPDFMVFKLSMLEDGAKSVKMSGFFNNNWELKGDDFMIEK